MFPNDDNLNSLFTLESEKSGIVEEVPFRMLILGDWSGDEIKKEFSLRSPIEIDRDNFDSVINRLSTKLELDLSLENNQFVSLTFNELDDFHPDNLYQQVPLFSDLRDLRRRLANPDTFNNAAREVRNWFNQENTIESNNLTSVPKNIDSEELLDQILSGKSENVKFQITQNAELRGLINDLVKPHLLTFDENEQKSLISIIDEATSNLMRKILHHPKFQMLESAWRSLYFLVKNTETDLLLKIYILDVTKDELNDKLKQCNSLVDSEIYRKVVVDSKNMVDGENWAVIFGNYDFQPNIDDITTLIRLSKIGSEIQTPFVSKVSDNLLGIESLFIKPEYYDWNFSEDSVNGKLWSTLRSLPESKFLGLTINRFLTRLPFGLKTDEIDSFSFEEFDDKLGHINYVWGNGCFIVALLLGHNFKKCGWQFGSLFEKDIENLPIHIYSNGFETITKPSTEIFLTQTASEKLIELGLMPLISSKSADRVRLAKLQSVKKPISALIGRWKNN